MHPVAWLQQIVIFCKTHSWKESFDKIIPIPQKPLNTCFYCMTNYMTWSSSADAICSAVLKINWLTYEQHAGSVAVVISSVQWHF